MNERTVLVALVAAWLILLVCWWLLDMVAWGSP